MLMFIFFGRLFSSVSILTLFHTAFTFELHFLFVTVLMFGLLITCITVCSASCSEFLYFVGIILAVEV